MKVCYEYNSTDRTLRSGNTSRRDRQRDACLPDEIRAVTLHTLGVERRFTMIPIADNGIVHLADSRSVDEVLEDLLSVLLTKGIVVFAVVDPNGEDWL